MAFTMLIKHRFIDTMKDPRDGLNDCKIEPDKIITNIKKSAILKRKSFIIRASIILNCHVLYGM